MSQETTTPDRSWRWIAPAGLMLIGFGVSLIGQAIIWKAEAEAIWPWVALGTLGLCVFNAGISIFGEAVVRRVKSDIQQVHS